MGELGEGLRGRSWRNGGQNVIRERRIKKIKALVSWKTSSSGIC